MNPEYMYLAFGVVLCAVLSGIAVFYYSRGRKDRVEHAKFKMLEDDDE